MFFFSEVTTVDVLKLIKRININKAMGEDQIRPKLIKTAGNFFAEPLLQILSTPVLVQVLSLTWQKEPHLQRLTRVVLISIFTQTIDLLLF